MEGELPQPPIVYALTSPPRWQSLSAVAREAVAAAAAPRALPPRLLEFSPPFTRSPLSDGAADGQLVGVKYLPP